MRSIELRGQKSLAAGQVVQVQSKATLRAFRHLYGLSCVTNAVKHSH